MMQSLNTDWQQGSLLVLHLLLRLRNPAEGCTEHSSRCQLLVLLLLLALCISCHLCRPTVGYMLWHVTLRKAVLSLVPFFLQQKGSLQSGHGISAVWLQAVGLGWHLAVCGACAPSCVKMQCPKPAYVKNISCFPKCKPAPTESPVP